MKKSIFYDHILTAARQERASVEEMIAYVASLGYVGADVIWSDRERLLEIYRFLKAADMKITSVCLFCDLNDTLDYEGFVAFFECLRECGCQNAMMIPQALVKDKDTGFAAVCGALNEICGIAADYDVRVSVEDFDSADAIVGSGASVEKILCAVPSLFHTFDTGNYAYFNESEIEMYERFKHRIVHVHLKDRAKSPLLPNEKATIMIDGSLVYPCPVGKGFIQIEECLKRLYAFGYTGYVSVEHFDVGDMKKAIRESSEFIDGILRAEENN